MQLHCILKVNLNNFYNKIYEKRIPTPNDSRNFYFYSSIVFQMNVIVMGISRENDIPLHVFEEFGFVFGFLRVCDLCQSRKHIYLSNVACKVTSDPRFADGLKSRFCCCGVPVTSVWRRIRYPQHLRYHFTTSRFKRF